MKKERKVLYHNPDEVLDAWFEDLGNGNFEKVTVIPCPCGKGEVVIDIESIDPNFDRTVNLKCKCCSKIWSVVNKPGELWYFIEKENN